MHNYTPVIIMSQNIFPFGAVQNEQFQIYRKILVKKKICYKNQSQYEGLKQKTCILKEISHKSLVNIRHIQQIQRGSMNIYYNYVHHNFQHFRGCAPKTVKDIHKQLIQLVIHLAKNSIMTTFNINRCGVKIIDGKQKVKFYMPINQMIICSQMSALERSIQLFTVQSMQALDQLAVGYGSMTQTQASILSLSQRLSFYQKRGKCRADSLNYTVKDKNKQLSASDSYSRKLSSRFNTTNSSATLKSRRSTLSTTRQNQSRQPSPEQKYFKFKQSLLQRITLLKNRSKKALKTLRQYLEHIKKAQKYKKQAKKDRKARSLQSNKKCNKTSKILYF